MVFSGCLLTKERILTDIAAEPTVLVEHTNEREIIVWDERDCKNIRFRFLEEFGARDLLGLILMSEDIPEMFRVDERALAEYLWNVMDRNAFMTLEKLVLIWSKDDEGFEDCALRGLAEEYGDDYALELGQGLLGQMWFERNVVVINMGEIVRVSEEIAQENKDLLDPWFLFENQVEVGFLTTVLHELRHLEMDTNIFLPEAEYPVDWASEENVEAYCREVFETHLVPDGLFFHSHHISLEDVLSSAVRASEKNKSEAGMYELSF